MVKLAIDIAKLNIETVLFYKLKNYANTCPNDK